MSERHTKHRPTKEVFYPVIGGTEPYYLGAWKGYILNNDNQYAYTTCYIPKDFDKLQEIKLVVLALSTLTPMNMRIVTDYAKAEEAYFQHNELEDFNLNTVLNRIQELNIEAVVDIRPLELGDYLGVQVSRQVGNNTNLIVLGVRIKYLYQ